MRIFAGGNRSSKGNGVSLTDARFKFDLIQSIYSFAADSPEAELISESSALPPCSSNHFRIIKLVRR